MAKSRALLVRNDSEWANQRYGLKFVGLALIAIEPQDGKRNHVPEVVPTELGEVGTPNLPWDVRQ